MALVTPAQVLSVTGTTVDESTVDRAQHVLHTHAGIMLVDPETLAAVGPESPEIQRADPADRIHLKHALCYQAAWQSAQIDYSSRTDVSDLGNTGVRFRDEHALILAPLASRCLARLSWKRKMHRNDPTRRDRGGDRFPAPPGVTVSTDPVDNPHQLDNFLTDAGPFGAVD